MEEHRQEFLGLCEKYLTRNGNAELLNWLKASDFFVAPASTRYHGSHEGGLVEHSLNVYRCLLEELNNTQLKNDYTDETVALVSLFHDVCKANYYKKGTRNVRKMDNGSPRMSSRSMKNSHAVTEKNRSSSCKILSS